MQHDTSPHRAMIGGVSDLVQTASLVLCYSRMLFIQLHPDLQRFDVQGVSHRRAASTSAARPTGASSTTRTWWSLRGTGRDDDCVPEMAAFAERFGFHFVAHEVGDANRSARVERPFTSSKTTSSPAARLRDVAHLNRDALAWCDRVNGTRKRHLHASPASCSLAEQPQLTPLPIWVPEVYALHHRLVDLEGYIHVGGNIYSVPYQLIGRRVEVRETKDHVRVFEGPRQVAVHERVLTFEKRRVTVPEHRPPRGAFAAHVRPCPPEEKKLAGAEPALAAYAAELKKRGTTRWTVALRRLWQMWRDYPRRCSRPSRRPRTTASTMSIASSGWCCARSPATTSRDQTNETTRIRR